MYSIILLTMSELQIDDPDPEPQPDTASEYPINLQTGLAFDDDELVNDLAERQGIYYLSAYANKLIESDLGEGDLRRRRIVTEDAELYRIITASNTMLFTFIDTLDGKRRCRAWIAEGVGVSWCEEQKRYEPADEVLARLKDTFALNEEVQPGKAVGRSMKKRILAALALR